MSSKKSSETGKKGVKQSEYEKSCVIDLDEVLERKRGEKMAKKAWRGFLELLGAVADGRVDLYVSFHLSKHDQSEYTEAEHGEKDC